MKYTRYAGLYDVMSAEPVYRSGRRAGIRGLRLAPGATVLDVGCGTGLNFSMIQRRVGAQGRIVGVDLSTQMLEQARRRADRHGWSNVELVTADATRLDATALPRPAGGFDAVLFTYTLSLMDPWTEAWRSTTSLARDGARVSVVDMRLPDGRAALLSPLARLACTLGGADIEAHPWTRLEAETGDQDAWSLRGGHVQVRTGTLGRRTGGHS